MSKLLDDLRAALCQDIPAIMDEALKAKPLPAPLELGFRMVADALKNHVMECKIPPALIARIEAMERNDARYRWLQEHIMALNCTDDDTDAGNFKFDCDAKPGKLNLMIDRAIAGGVK